MLRLFGLPEPPETCSERWELEERSGEFVMRRSGNRCFEAGSPGDTVLLLERVLINAYFENLPVHSVALHAAALSREDRLFVWTGAPDAGKSTASAVLLKNGFRYLTDELIGFVPSELYFYPFPRQLNIEDAGNFGLSEHRVKDSQGNWFTGGLPDSHRTQASSRSYHHVHFLELQRDSSAGSDRAIRPRTPGQAHLDLLRHAAVPTDRGLGVRRLARMPEDRWDAHRISYRDFDDVVPGILEELSPR